PRLAQGRHEMATITHVPGSRKSAAMGYWPGEQSMKILLIEDDREAASYLIQALDEAGHVTHHAADGESGYAMASGMDYDVLIVDRMLPRREGLSIVESLRAEDNHTPVLILSALGEVD